MTHITLEPIKLVAKEKVTSTMNSQKHFIRKDDNTAVYPYLLRADEPTEEEVEDRDRQWFELQHDNHCSSYVEDHTQAREIILGGSEISLNDKLFQMFVDGDIKDGDTVVGFFTVVNGTYCFSGVNSTSETKLEFTDEEHKSANRIHSIYINK